MSDDDDCYHRLNSDFRGVNKCLQNSMTKQSLAWLILFRLFCWKGCLCFGPRVSSFGHRLLTPTKGTLNCKND